MSLFGSNPGEPDPGHSMIDWIVAAPPAELAPELMEAFSPNIPRRVPWLGTDDFEERMFPGYPKRTGMIVAARPVTEPILEAVQLLEHAELVPNWSKCAGCPTTAPAAPGRPADWVERRLPTGRPRSGSASRIEPASK